MLVIEEADFRLEEEEESPGRWNLYLLKHIGGSNPRDELQLEGYGYTLMYALRIIILKRIAKRQEVCSLKEFATFYKEESTILYNLLKGIDGLRSFIL